MNLVAAIIDLFSPAPYGRRGPTAANLRADAVVARRRANWPDGPGDHIPTRQSLRQRQRRGRKELRAALAGRN